MVIGIQNADVVKMSKAITKAFIIYNSINLAKNRKIEYILFKKPPTKRVWN